MALVRARTSTKAAHPQALIIMELEAKQLSLQFALSHNVISAVTTQQNIAVSQCGAK